MCVRVCPGCMCGFVLGVFTNRKSDVQGRLLHLSWGCIRRMVDVWVYFGPIAESSSTEKSCPG